MSDSNPASTRRPLSSKEYIEQLRQRRVEKHAPQPEPQRAPAPYEQHPQERPLSEPAQMAPESYSPTSPTTTELIDKLPDFPKPEPEETVFSWKAASRPFKKRDRQYYTTIAVIVFLISLILFFAGQFLPIAVVVSVGFLAYVLSSVPPETTENKLTTYGIRVENSLFYWEELGRFWFEDKFNQPIIHIETTRFPNRLTMVLGEVKKEELKDMLSQVLLEEKPKPTLYDKMAQWLQEKIPLEITNT